MIGQPVVYIGLDYDQSIGASTFDSRKMTLISPTPDQSASALNLPMDGAIVMDITYSYGRDRFIVGDFETGLATIVLNNNNGEWSPSSGVNTIGGEKIQPGMIVDIGYHIDADVAEAYVEAASGDAWAQNIVGGFDRPVIDAETVTGHVDNRTWTAHVASPGDIDVALLVHPVTSPPAVSGQTDTWHRFSGRIIRLEDRYEPGGRGAITVLTVADFMADLSLYNPGPLVSPRSAEGTDTRFAYIAGEAINDGNFYDTGSAIYDVESTDLPGNYLEEARVAARAEGGAVFADHGANRGMVTFKHANWLLEDVRSATIQAIIGDTRIGIVAAVTDYSASRIFNDLYYANSSTTVNVSDSTSIADYSARSLRRTILNNDNTDLDSLADRDLALLKDARLVVVSVELHPNNLWEELFCAGVSVGDLLDVTIENRGWSYQQYLHVSGVSNAWNAASGDWACTIRLDSRDGDTVVS